MKQLVLFAAALLALAADPASAAQSTTPSGYAGSFVTQGNNTSFYSNGHFVGSAVRNGDGTTSFYDRSGHPTGSSPVQNGK